MPLRLLREDILSSERIDQLDWPAEVFYRRLMSKVDDFGLFDARPSMLRSSLYPLRVDRVREADITRWIAACEKAGVIALYVHGGKPYGQMMDTRWQTRSEPKHPIPPWGKGGTPQAADSNCNQPQAIAHLDVVVVGDVVEDGDGKEKGARKRSPGFDAAGIVLPEWLAREDWLRWCEDRAKRKKPITEAAAKLQVAKLEEFRGQGHEPKGVIDTSIANGWQGLFAPANNRSQGVVGSKHTGFADKDYTEGVNPDGSLV